MNLVGKALIAQGGSVTIERTGEYSVDYILKPLHLIAGLTLQSQ